MKVKTIDMINKMKKTLARLFKRVATKCQFRNEWESIIVLIDTADTKRIIKKHYE